MELFKNEDGLYEVKFTVPQTEFRACTAKYKLFVAGFGAGKSTAMTTAIMEDLGHPAKGLKIGAYAPTYDLLKLITVPNIHEMLYYAGLEQGKDYKYNGSDYIFYLSNDRQIICRSMDNPNRIVGYQTFRSHIDEIDTLRKEQAENAWNKIIARNRQQIPITDENGNYIYCEADSLPEEEREFAQIDYIVTQDGEMELVEANEGTHIRMNHPNGVNAYSTPEGFNFCYERWVKNKKEGDGYEKIKAPTYSNPFLPSDYIPNLRKTYPAELIEAYIEGEFVNLTSGAVYRNFDRELNHTDEEIKGGEVLHIGMDFNVLKMSAAVFVIRDGKPMQLAEIFGADDTPHMCQIIDERYPSHQVIIYPDSSGKNTTSKSASKSDISIIRGFGYSVRAKNKNPFVKDRVSSVNAMILNGSGERRYKINTNNCPVSVECLEQQVYGTDGTPDKKAGKDHMPDAIGYFIFYAYPVKSSGLETKKVVLFRR